MDDRVDHYNKLSIGLHWLTFLLLVAVYALMEFRGIFPKNSDPHNLMKTWHYMLGLTVFCIVFLRLVLRWAYRAPPIIPRPSAWMHRSATAMHSLLYLFLIVMPLLGWLLLSAKGSAIPFFGLHWPALTEPDKALAGRVKEIHETLGNIGYYLIGLHAAAALFHHYFVRDNTLSRMLPVMGRTSRDRRVPP